MPWIRIIKPETELRTLLTRENLTSEELAYQQIRCPLPTEHVAKINFTPTSAFQFFTDGVPQRFFDEGKSDFREKFGLVVKRTDSDRRVAFRNSMRTEVSDNIFKESLTVEQFRQVFEGNGFIPTTEREVSRLVRTTHADLVKQYEREGLDPKDAKLPWTEGLFRHKFSDIDGILIHNHKASIRNGYAFAKIVEEVTSKKTEFYMWNDKKSELTKIDRQKIRDALGFEAKEPDSQKLVIDDATQARIDEYKTHLTQARRGGR